MREPIRAMLCLRLAATGNNLVGDGSLDGMLTAPITEQGAPCFRLLKKPPDVHAEQSRDLYERDEFLLGS
jgi:hypothetical protein